MVVFLPMPLEAYTILPLTQQPVKGVVLPVAE